MLIGRRVMTVRLNLSIKLFSFWGMFFPFFPLHTSIEKYNPTSCKAYLTGYFCEICLGKRQALLTWSRVKLRWGHRSHLLAYTLSSLPLIDRVCASKACPGRDDNSPLTVCEWWPWYWYLFRFFISVCIWVFHCTFHSCFLTNNCMLHVNFTSKCQRKGPGGVWCSHSPGSDVPQMGLIKGSLNKTASSAQSKLRL